jgi:hypothetical protein
MPDLPGFSVARESLVPLKIAQARAGRHHRSARTLHRGAHARTADGESRKVEWQMTVVEDD